MLSKVEARMLSKVEASILTSLQWSTRYVTARIAHFMTHKPEHLPSVLVRYLVLETLIH